MLHAADQLKLCGRRCAHKQRQAEGAAEAEGIQRPHERRSFHVNLAADADEAKAILQYTFAATTSHHYAAIFVVVRKFEGEQLGSDGWTDDVVSERVLPDEIADFAWKGEKAAM